MNDFTKDELMEIRACVCNIDGNVLAKIQSLIDNFCEHEFYANGCGNNMFAQCHKCGEIRRVIRNDNQ